MTSTVSNAVQPKTKDGGTKQTKSLQLSSNWNTLRKSVQPISPSKKRKLNEESNTNGKMKSPETRIKKHLTTYNPWKPNALPIRNKGNPALVIPSHTSNDIKFTFLCCTDIDPVDTWRLIVRWLDLGLRGWNTCSHEYR
jgi:hypothetical protein